MAQKRCLFLHLGSQIKIILSIFMYSVVLSIKNFDAFHLFFSQPPDSRLIFFVVKSWTKKSRPPLNCVSLYLKFQRKSVKVFLLTSRENASPNKRFSGGRKSIIVIEFILCIRVCEFASFIGQCHLEFNPNSFRHFFIHFCWTGINVILLIGFDKIFSVGL